MKKKIAILIIFIEELEKQSYHQAGEVFIVLKAIKDKLKQLL